MSMARNKKRGNNTNQPDGIQLETPRATPEPGASNTSYKPSIGDRATRARFDHQNQDRQSKTTHTSPRNDSPQSGLVPTIHVEGSSDIATEDDGAVSARVETNENSGQDNLEGDMDIDEKSIEDIVEDLITEKGSENPTLDMTRFAIDVGTDLHEYFKFFDGINQTIRDKCLTKGVDPSGFYVPRETHHDALKSLREDLEPYRADIVSADDQQAIRDHCNQAYNHISSINQLHNLPLGWNINVEEILNAVKAMNLGKTINNSSTAVHDLVDDDLDALESRTRKDQNQLSSCEVMRWWPKGTGTQTFVQYGDKSAPIYRIRAGSYEMYDKRSVERLWTTSSRGTEKEKVDTVDGQDEIWKYGRCDVKKIIAVGWKVPDDDDSEIDALSLIKPERGAIYPQTKCMILWTDGETTLEGRSFMRRIANGPAFRGDQMIYQKAKELEAAYEERNGPLQGGHDSQKDEDESGDSSSDLDDMGTYPSDRELSFTGSKQKGRPNYRKEKPHRRGTSKRDDAIIKLERQLAKLKSNRKGSRSQRG